MTAGIYCLQVERPGKPSLFYVGRAANLNRRKAEHFRRLRRRANDNQRLQALFDKYGESAFSFRIILRCGIENLQRYEQSILDFYLESFGRRVLNICRECAASPLGVKHTAASRANMTAARRARPGQPCSPETRAKISAVKNGQPLSQAARIAQRIAVTGSKHSLETRAKMSASQRKRKDSPETRHKKHLAAMQREARKRVALMETSSMLNNS